MNVQCPSCQTSFPIDPKKIPEGGVHARCSVCPEVFFVAEAPAAPVTPEDTPLSAQTGEPPAIAGESVWGPPDLGTPTKLAEEAEEPEVLGEPEAVEEPQVFEEPEAVEEPQVFEEPAEYEEPEGFEEPEAVEEPQVFEEPAGYEEAEGFEVPEAVEEPQVFEEPEGFEEPQVAAEPEAVEEPQVFEEPEAAEEPVEFEEPEAFEEPQVFEEPEGFEELEAVEEPQVFEEPAGFEETEAVEEPQVFEEPEAAEEPVEPAEQVEAQEPKGPPPTPTGTIPFGRRDPTEKAERLARVLVSDIILYNPDRHRIALESGSLKAEFEEEIQKSWAEYVEQVGEDVAGRTSFFNDALNEILAKGEQIF